MVRKAAQGAKSSAQATPVHSRDLKREAEEATLGDGKENLMAKRKKIDSSDTPLPQLEPLQAESHSPSMTPHSPISSIMQRIDRIMGKIRENELRTKGLREGAKKT